MKKLFIKLICCLLVFCVLFVSCGKDVPAVADPPSVSVPSLHSSVQEYGEPQSAVNYGDSHSASVFYPVGNIDAADTEIRKWAEALVEDTVSDMKKEAGGNPDFSGELNVDYDSYITNNKYAAVKETGYLLKASELTSIIYTLNIDIQKQEILSVDDVFLSEHLDKVFSLLTGELVKNNVSVAENAKIDKTWLKNFVITHNGIEILFLKSDIMSDINHVETVFLSYDEISEYLSLDIDVETALYPPRPSPEVSSGTNAEKPNVLATITCKADKVNVRKEPSTSSKIVGTVSYGDKLEVTQKNPSDGWIKVWFEDQEAYVSDSLVTYGEVSPIPKFPMVSFGDVDKDKPMIALTFDDGAAKSTITILDLLEEYGGRATFFVVGNRVKGNADILKRAASLNCEIANHTWSHKQLTTLSEQQIRDELTKTSDAIKEYVGVDCVLLRPPYGSVNKNVKEVAISLNMPIALWCVDTLDWKTKNAQSTYDTIMKEAKDGDIILCHDLQPSTAEAMKKAIPELSKKFQLVTVSELLTNSKDGMKAGSVYRNSR